MINKVAIVEVETNEIKEMEQILNRSAAHPDYKSDHTFETYVADFGDGIEADIKVCNGDTPYVDAVLFDAGCEVDVLDVSDELLGAYAFQYENSLYTVIVRPKETVDATL